LSLTFVPTPLGNLRDITLRAIDVLRAADLVVAEDTRVARRLLSALEITGKRLASYREQNAAAATAFILERAATGLVAVVSDAGTPGISDPGRELIVAARSAGIAVEVLPGPVAFVVAAVLSGFSLERLVFCGFVPRAAGARTTALQNALASSTTSAWYESPNRIVATLERLAALAPSAPLFVARELSKRHEQQVLGTPAEALAALERPVRGEIVLVIAPNTGAAPARAAESDDLDAAIDAALAAGLSVAAAAKAVARRHNAERSVIYARVTARKRAREARPGEAPH
jgi:16S rRNA (cytidine1402-2'-O)-methyltransferase